MRKVILSVVTFIGLCLAGAFVCLAGGVRWGAPDCGFGAFTTLFFAAVAVAAINTKGDNHV